MTKIFLSIRYKYNGKSFIDLSQNQKNTKRKIISDFKEGILKWENNKCRCSSNKDLTISMKDRYGFKVRTVLCKNCGLLRTDPRISEDTIEIFYRKYYRNLLLAKPDKDFGKKLHSTKHFSVMIHGEKILRYIKQYSSLKKGVVFDFGTGGGGILKIFKDAGFETFGVDLDEDRIKDGIKEGLNLKVGNIEELKNYPKKANLIIVSHVLEHLHNLDKTLKIFKECLDEEGYLYVELPGIFKLQNQYGNFLSFLGIDHLFHFTLLTLRKLLAENGFIIVAGNEEIMALFQPSSQKNTIKISKDYIYDILTYLRIVDIPLPINAWNIIKNKLKIRNKILLIIISIIYKTNIINVLAFLRKSLNQKLVIKYVVKKYLKYLFSER